MTETRTTIRPDGDPARYASEDARFRMMKITLVAEPFRLPVFEPQRVTYRPDPDRADRTTILAASDASLPVHRRPCRPDANPDEDAYAARILKLTQREGHHPGFWVEPKKNAARKEPAVRRHEEEFAARIEAVVAAMPPGWHTTGMMRPLFPDWHPSLLSAALRAAAGRGLMKAQWTFRHGEGCHTWEYRRVQA